MRLRTSLLTGTKASALALRTSEVLVKQRFSALLPLSTTIERRQRSLEGSTEAMPPLGWPPHQLQHSMISKRQLLRKKSTATSSRIPSMHLAGLSQV